MSFLRQIAKILPTLGLSFALALAVWISAVTASDPVERHTIPQPVPVEYIGQNPHLVLVGNSSRQVIVTISSPRSTWENTTNPLDLVAAQVDLAGLGAGEHSLPIEVTPRTRLVTVGSITPEKLTVRLENLASKPYSIHLIRQGEPAIGFQAEDPTISADTASVTGPESLVNQVKEIRATLILGDTHENIVVTIPLQAIDANETLVDGVTIQPARITVTQPITQRGGFRSDLVVRPIFQGKIANGYRLTTISVFPPAVTVFSPDPKRVTELPGYVETMPVNLENAKDDFEIPIDLNLPKGISLVGDQPVTVQIGIAAIESSLNLTSQQIRVINLSPKFGATLSPQTVDLIVSGPLPILDTLTPGDIQVVVDLSSLSASGTYQVVPQVEMRNNQLKAALRVDSILPGSVEVVLGPPPTPTATPKPTPRP
ncbi:MAG TPA: CdaR family protein [Anaerolineaceae bacterium]|nr:CdaR family protein [Anaerolineaceae bacterium]